MNTEDAYLSAVRYARAKHLTEHERLMAAVEVAQLHSIPIQAIATAAGVHRTTIYRWLKESAPKGQK